VVDAVQCAVEIQQVLRAKNALLPENRRMEFRIGINLGDVIEEGNRIYGDGVNIAARLEALAEAGGICISGSAYEQIENKLPLRYEYLGEHEVKNIIRPVRVYRARIDPEAAASKSCVRKGPGRSRPSKAYLSLAAIVMMLGAGVLWQFILRPPPHSTKVASLREDLGKVGLPAEPSSRTVVETQRKEIIPVTNGEYVVPTKPVDRHAIGWAWSKQFGPVESPNVDEIRIKKEESFNNAQCEFARNVGLALEAERAEGVGTKTFADGGKGNVPRPEGVEVISPVSLADIPFEPNIAYITEALRLTSFHRPDERSSQAPMGRSANVPLGGSEARAESRNHGRNGLAGEGLVVAYKLHRIDLKTYMKTESGIQRLELNRPLDFARMNVIIKVRLQTIEPGANKSLPENLLWPCSIAKAGKRDMVAAWIVEIRLRDQKRKSLEIAFPAFPEVEDCQNYRGTIFSRIDPFTDKIVRERIDITIVDAGLSDVMKPKTWDGRVNLINESFNVRVVKPSEVGN